VLVPADAHEQRRGRRRSPHFHGNAKERMFPMTPAEFIAARLDEDEATARAAVDPDRPGTHWQWVRRADDVVVEAPTWEDMDVSLRTVEKFERHSVIGPLPAFVLNSVGVDEPRALPHIARHDPARVLRQVAALRAVMEIHEPVKSSLPSFTAPMVCGVCSPGKEEGWDAPCPTLRHLASIWSDHEDYDPAWATA
jgi:hypothetical protein